MAALSHEYVGRLDIAMDDSLCVGGVESIGDFDGEIEKQVEIERAARDAMLERGAFHVFHSDEDAAIVLADFIDRADIGMIQCGGGAGFAAKTLESLRILRNIFGEKLQGDEAAEIGVFGLVNDSHASATELFDNPVVGERSAD